MKSNAKKIDFPTLCLLLVLVTVLICIVTGTIWVFATGRALPGTAKQTAQTDGIRNRQENLFSSGKRNPSRESVVKADPDMATAIFGDIGVLRAATADTAPVTIVVSPFFPYKKDDVAFREELVSKKQPMRLAVLEWFHEHTVQEINTLGESGVKTDLIQKINSLLVLGKIDILYFDEYMAIQ